MRRLTRLSLVAAAALVIVACTSGVGSSVGPSTSSSPRASISASATPEVSPAQTTTFGGPPHALLTVGDAPPRRGLEGSGQWSEGGSTAFRNGAYIVPSPEPAVAADAVCSIALADGTQILAWSARVAPTVDDWLQALTLVDSGGGPVTEAEFACPGAGDWMIEARLGLAHGDQDYYWRLVIR